MVVACQTADTVTTVQGMERGARELNPIVNAIFSAAGVAGFIAAKAGVTLLVLHYHAEISTGVLATANVITCGAAVHNASIMSKLPPKPPRGEKPEPE
ncbi:MAG TPA: DUF5658 family protein [Burkholderiales bacterium]|nr:DUF5658 family protein [Burkholderiales bacterium]